MAEHIGLTQRAKRGTMTAIICRFDTTSQLTGKKHTYATVKAAALEAGRFSVFEATATPRDAKLFTRLCADPEVETFQLGFPWTGVRCREVQP